MDQKKGFTAILLAGGQGTRMKSPLPKVLHPVAGHPMISRSVHALREAGANEIRVVVGQDQNLVRQVLEPLGVHCFQQQAPNGTADAVASAKPEKIKGPLLVMNGDHPLVQPKDIQHIFQTFNDSKAHISVVTSKVKNPGRLGRIVTHQGQLKAIVEASDASTETLKIHEVNTGIYCFQPSILNTYLPQIQARNQQGEYYLTDIVSLCAENQEKMTTIPAPSHVAFGVNTQEELSRATRFAFWKKNKQLLAEGVMIIDPKLTYIEDDVTVGPAAVIYPGTYLRSGTQIGRFCVIEPHCYIVESTLGASVHVKAGSYIEKTSIANKVLIGPYARLRPGTNIGEGARVGNFVEMKRVDFKAGAKANHLTYLGDAIVGENTNIGCGTITCNYAVDKKKYVTKIGKNVFVGSDTQLIAPVEVGDRAVIASGSTITKDVPEGSLAIARGRQIVKENYSPQKIKKD